MKTSCAVRDQPEVWQWVRSVSDLGFVGSKRAMRSAQIMRAARSLAISMNGFIPMAKKKLSRGAKSSTESPAAMPLRTYSIPSASV